MIKYGENHVKNLILIVLFALHASGCTTIGVMEMKSDLIFKASNCKLDIFSSEKEIEKPFEVVCLIDVKTGTSAFHDTTGPGAINEARPAACKCGADGILVMQMGISGDGFLIPKTGNATIKAIRYKARN